MKRTVISTLAYAVRISKLGDRPDLQDHGDEIIRSIEKNYLPHSTTVDEASTSDCIKLLSFVRVTNPNGDHLGDAAFNVTLRPNWEIETDITIEGIAADNHSLFEECDCGPTEEETPEDFEHWEDCQLGNEEMYSDYLGDELSLMLSRELTDEEHIGLSDLQSHLQRATA